MLNKLIEQLKNYDKVWKEFNYLCKKNNYHEFFQQIDKYLKLKNIYILHDYHPDTLKVEYIVYYKGEIIDMNDELNIFANPYWHIIIDCFKFLSEQ